MSLMNVSKSTKFQGTTDLNSDCLLVIVILLGLIVRFYQKCHFLNSLTGLDIRVSISTVLLTIASATFARDGLLSSTPNWEGVLVTLSFFPILIHLLLQSIHFPIPSSFVLFFPLWTWFFHQKYIANLRRTQHHFPLSKLPMLTKKAQT